MTIADSLQKYNRNGISKIISPSNTLKIVLKKIFRVNPPIISRYGEIRKETKIPQFIVRGTDHYATYVNRIGRGGSTRSSNGKGYKKSHALVSGLMEMAERYSCNKFLVYKPGKTTVLQFKTIKNNLYGESEFFANPVFKKKTEILSRRYWDTAKLIWHTGYNLAGKKTLLPVSIITYMHEITNGMATGNSLEEALLHGICEVVERHCKGYIRENKITPPTIDEKTIKYKTVKVLLGKYKKIDQRVALMNYSMDLGIPVIAAVRRIKAGKCVVTVGVAPHPEEAMTRALTENSQAEKYREINYFSHLFKKSPLFDSSKLPNIYHKNIKTELSTIEKLLLEKNMKIWYLDMTDKVLDIPAVFVHISNTRRNNVDLAYRNIIIGLIEEGLKMRDYSQMSKYLKIGKQKDKINKNLYDYYQGVLYGLNKKYDQAFRAFTEIKKPEDLYEMRTFINIQKGIALLMLGETEKAINYFSKNIKNYPKMNFIYLRYHHFFLEKSQIDKTKHIYESLRLISGKVDIGKSKFQKEFAKKINYE